MSTVRAARIFVLVLLITAVIVAAILLFGTEEGRSLLREPQVIGGRFRDWIDANPVMAVLAFVGIYWLLAMLMLPLWWMQFLAGMGFGIVSGVVWVQCAAVLAAVMGMHLTRWLGRAWFQGIETRMPRLRRLEEALGHNGLLTVIVVRLVRGVPFGAANYAFGLTRISTIDVALGTLLGGLPPVSFYVTLGARPDLLTDWRFAPATIAMALFLLVPLALRYLFPARFRKIGIE